MEKKVAKKYLQEWIKLYNEGHSMREIARQYSFSLSTVRLTIKPYITVREKSPNLKYMNEWIELYSRGYTKKDIANQYNVSHVVVGSILKKAGLVSARKSARKFDHLKYEFKKLYIEGHSLTEIANRYNTCRQTILNYLNELETDVRDYSDACRILNMKEDYFKDLDDKKLFMLGIIFMNGWLSLYKNVTSKLVISTKNEELIKWIIRELYYKEDLNKVNVYQNYNCKKVEVYSKKLIKDLRDLNFAERKSIILPDLNKKQKKAFLDGFLYASFYYDSKVYRTKSTKIEYIDEIKNYLMNELEIEQNDIIIKSNIKSYISVSKRSEMMKIKKHLETLRNKYIV